MTIGFNAVSSLAAGKVDAATGFWNAEGVALRRQGVPVRIFKVDDYGAPPYPELILTTSRKTLERDPDLVRAVIAATARGYALAGDDPSRALDDLLAADPALDRADQAAQLRRPAARPPTPRPFDTASSAPGPPGTSSTACSSGRRHRRRLRASTCRAQALEPASSRSASAGSSRAIRERGTTRSTPAASAALRVSTSTCE